MNITIYVAIAIIIILIIFYFCFRQYLINTQSTTITLNDGNALNHSCIYDKKTKIIFCQYIVNNKKIVFTDMINNILSNWEDNSRPFIFNSMDYNLPQGGILKIRLVCNSIKNNNFANNNFANTDFLNTHSTDVIIPIDSTSTQNPIYSGNSNISYFLQQVDNSKKNNELYDILNTIEKNEINSTNIEYKTANSYLDNVFIRKYPQVSITNRLSKIDPEYILSGLKGDARLMDI